MGRAMGEATETSRGGRRDLARVPPRIASWYRRSAVGRWQRTQHAFAGGLLAFSEEKLHPNDPDQAL
jgi:hypothetical protein